MSDPQLQAELRGRAASRLTGTAATKGSAASAADALTLLHALASSPETASDALTLLHELHVHQVDLYDFQPVGRLTIDPQWVLHELNQTGADMLGSDAMAFLDCPLTDASNGCRPLARPEREFAHR